MVNMRSESGTDTSFPANTPAGNWLASRSFALAGGVGAPCPGRTHTSAPSTHNPRHSRRMVRHSFHIRQRPEGEHLSPTHPLSPLERIVGPSSRVQGGANH